MLDGPPTTNIYDSFQFVLKVKDKDNGIQDWIASSSSSSNPNPTSTTTSAAASNSSLYNNIKDNNSASSSSRATVVPYASLGMDPSKMTPREEYQESLKDLRHSEMNRLQKIRNQPRRNMKRDKKPAALSLSTNGDDGDGDNDEDYDDYEDDEDDEDGSDSYSDDNELISSMSQKKAPAKRKQAALPLTKNKKSKNSKVAAKPPPPTTTTTKVATAAKKVATTVSKVAKKSSTSGSRQGPIILNDDDDDDDDAAFNTGSVGDHDDLDAVMPPNSNDDDDGDDGDDDAAFNTGSVDDHDDLDAVMPPNDADDEGHNGGPTERGNFDSDDREEEGEEEETTHIFIAAIEKYGYGNWHLILGCVKWLRNRFNIYQIKAKGQDLVDNGRIELLEHGQIRIIVDTKTTQA